MSGNDDFQNGGQPQLWFFWSWGKTHIFCWTHMVWHEVWLGKVFCWKTAWACKHLHFLKMVGFEKSGPRYVLDLYSKWMHPNLDQLGKVQHLCLQLDIHRGSRAASGSPGANCWGQMLKYVEIIYWHTLHGYWKNIYSCLSDYFPIEQWLFFDIHATVSI